MLGQYWVSSTRVLVRTDDQVGLITLPVDNKTTKSQEIMTLWRLTWLLTICGVHRQQRFPTILTETESKVFHLHLKMLSCKQTFGSATSHHIILHSCHSG